VVPTLHDDRVDDAAEELLQIGKLGARSAWPRDAPSRSLGPRPRAGEPKRGGRLVAIDYEVHETRGKTPRSRRRIDLDPATVGVLTAWREWQRAEQRAAGIEGAGWMFTDGGGQSIHPHAISQAFERIARRAGVPVIRLHELRHTHGTLLIAAGVPVKVVSEPARSRHARLHDRDVPPRAPRHASRRRSRVRTARGVRPPPVDHVPEKSVETREKVRKKTV
jgi:integrase